MKKSNGIDFIKKLAIYIVLLFLIISITFFAINFLVEPQIKKNIAVYENISPNYWNRYTEFLSNLFTFKSGKIYSQELASANMSILQIYFYQFKWTLLFTILIFTFSLIIGNLLGVWSAYKFEKTPDFIINLIIGLLSVIPLIIIAIIALSSSLFLGYPSQFIFNPGLSFISLLVPIFIMMFGCISLFHARSRKAVREILKSEYYLFATSLGFSKIKLFNKVILKQLVINQLQIIVPYYLLLFTTSLAIERIFSIPGQSVFISYIFSKGEINMITFYFTFSFFVIMIFKYINDIILDKINPQQISLRQKLIIKKARVVR
ncbi:ABC transporter permease subunit [[Mycoplasma] falconis]|uniref:ABC transporter permease subunit n=1 Tax=[Mycoplasma] falconis TaxID=92403 RepID=A0A501X8S5_9BACT|nr:ABC transporter permease subunit [[Mycoplasma] falconis]TPE56930.1 ABC transporter permease subunit [[Mycoplasma] falconis]